MLGAVSVVCCDEQGVFRGVSVVVSEGITDLEVLEAMAHREALSLGEELHSRKLKISSEYLRVMSKVQADINSGGHCMILKEKTGRSSFLACEVAMNGVLVIWMHIDYPEW